MDTSRGRQVSNDDYGTKGIYLDYGDQKHYRWILNGNVSICRCDEEHRGLVSTRMARIVMSGL